MEKEKKENQQNIADCWVFGDLWFGFVFVVWERVRKQCGLWGFGFWDNRGCFDSVVGKDRSQRLGFGILCWRGFDGFGVKEGGDAKMGGKGQGLLSNNAG